MLIFLQWKTLQSKLSNGVLMTTVFVNAHFISLNAEGDIYSVMVVSGKEIVYVGYNTPICYDSERVIDLNDGYVLPMLNDMVYYDSNQSMCSVLEAGQRADFIVVDRNVLKEEQPYIREVYIKGKKKV